MAFAGSFYPSSAPALRQVLKDCFTGSHGPGELPRGRDLGKVPLKGVICPHAGYSYSGMAAAWGYKAIAETALPDVFILLGPNHNSRRSGISLEGFETPLGNVRVDQTFAEALVRKGAIARDEQIHAREHSIEVQLPLLVFALGDRASQAKIVPILVSEDIDLARVALDIKETLVDQGKTATFIVSSDFTHYGAAYHYVPFIKDVKGNLAKLDGKLLELIRKGDWRALGAEFQETQATVCGALPILLFLRTVHFERASLEQYYTSGDIAGDSRTSVSYASMTFK